MILKATLKKPWRSQRGKLYPTGTTFELDRVLIEIDSCLYSFKIPGICHGFVVLPNKVFKQLTAEEQRQKNLRKKAVEEHVRLTTDPFVSFPIVLER